MTFSYTTAASCPLIRTFMAVQFYIADHDDCTETKTNRIVPTKKNRGIAVHRRQIWKVCTYVTSMHIICNGERSATKFRKSQNSQTCGPK
jgi:hypothetical protein